MLSATSTLNLPSNFFVLRISGGTDGGGGRADLVALLRGSKEQLVQQLAEEVVGGGPERRTSQTVASRFRDQLRRLMERLEGCSSSSLSSKAKRGLRWEA